MAQDFDYCSSFLAINEGKGSSLCICKASRDAVYELDNTIRWVLGVLGGII